MRCICEEECCNMWSRGEVYMDSKHWKARGIRTMLCFRSEMRVIIVPCLEVGDFDVRLRRTVWCFLGVVKARKAFASRGLVL